MSSYNVRLETDRRTLVIWWRSLGKAAGAAVLAAVFGLLPSGVLAQSAEEYPSKPIEIVVPFGPGGGIDLSVRLVQPYLEKNLKVPVIVQNVSGAGSQIGSTRVYRAEPDGYTVLATNLLNLYGTAILQDADYGIDDWDVLAVDIADRMMIIVPKESPFENFAQFVEAARAEAGAVAVSVTTGTSQEWFAQWLEENLDLDLTIVGYGSGAEAGNAILGGHVDAHIGDDYSRYNIRHGARSLAIMSSEPTPRWPEAPLMKDVLAPFGVELPDPDYLARYLIYVVRSEFRKNHPDQYAKLESAFLAAGHDPEYRSKIEKLGFLDMSMWRPASDFTQSFKASLDAVEAIAKNK